MEDNRYTREIIGRINKGEFANEAEFKQFLDNVVRMVDSNQVIKQDFYKFGIYDKEDTAHKNFYNAFMEEYHKKYPVTNINVDGIRKINVDGTEYLEFEDSEDKTHLIDDTREDKTIVEQVEEKQKESLDYQGLNAEDNKDQVLSAIRDERKEYDLTSTVTANTEVMSQEDKKEHEMITSNLKDRELIYNTEAGIYVDKNSGENYNVIETSTGDKKINKIGETTSDAEKIVHLDSETYNPTGVEQPVDNEVKEDDEIEDVTTLSDADLEILLARKEQLKAEYLRRLEAEKERRKALNVNVVTEPQLEKTNKVKQLVMTPYNGFVSFVTLTMIVTAYGVGFLIYLFTIIK